MNSINVPCWIVKLLGEGWITEGERFVIVGSVIVRSYCNNTCADLGG